MPRIAITCLVCSAALTGCGNKEPQVGAVVATAATLEVIQLAREQDPDNRPPVGECCMLCGPCEFPCGDRCVPFGTFCASPAGCACAQIPKGTTGDPVPVEHRTNDCDPRLMFPVPGAD